MLTTIQELEREIEQFHKNVKESNELMNILMSVTALTKTQTEAFDTRTKALYEDLAKLPPELSELVQKKIADFIQSIHSEQQAYQASVAQLIGGYTDKIANAESTITNASTAFHDEASKLPIELSELVQKKIEDFVQNVRNEQQAYQATVTQLMDAYADKIAKAEGAISEAPTALEAQLKKDRAESAEELKKVQEQFASELSKANAAFAEQLKSIVENIQSLSAQIKDDSAQQYAAFLKELEKMMETRLEQLAQTENRVSELSQQLESKYNAFVEKLESTNMDQLYKYCQDMNKAINLKLGLLFGGVAVAVIVSIVSLFI